MNLYDINKIRDMVTVMRGIKASSFYNRDRQIDFQNVKETCRIIDILLLPLFYIWEHYCHRPLKDICFEEHLRKPYRKFIRNPITYTWELYIFITLYEPIIKVLKKKKTHKEISYFYLELVDSHKNVKKQSHRFKKAYSETNN